jgi:SulP family sulfate permease
MRVSRTAPSNARLAPRIRLSQPSRTDIALDTAAFVRRFEVATRNGIKDVIAGVVASVVLVANIISFGALMFPGALSAGIPIAVWAMLIGSCIGGLWIAWATSLPPLASGIDSPTGAVLVVLSANVAATVVHAGGSTDMAVTVTMLIFSLATLLSAALLLVLGLCRWGSYFRFVPYFVVAGFVAATGWLLIAGGLRMTVGRAVTMSNLLSMWTPSATAKLAVALAALLVMLAVRRWVKSAVAMPVAILVMAAAGGGALAHLGLAGPEHGWYLPSIGALTPWKPLEALQALHLPWQTIAALVPEVAAVAIVALISLLTKVSTLEVSRKASGDLDQEFRAHGIGNLVAAPFGGLMCHLQTGTSRLLEQAGGATRMSGAACAIALGAVGIAGINLPGLIPIPIVAGLLFFLGYTFFMDALLRPCVQRAWMDLVLAVGIMVVCIAYGFLNGVLLGVIGACVSFAISYARLGVVRRHVTRAHFTGYVSRSAQAADYLRAQGDAIQLYWLSGYIFFGSSEGIYERIRADVESLPPLCVRYVILDFDAVPGADSSAMASLAKLRNYCDRRGITLVYAAVAKPIRTALQMNGLLARNVHEGAFGDLNHALGWCEDRLLEEANVETSTGIAGFDAWLQHQIGPQLHAADLLEYLQRKDVDGEATLYRQGDPADTVDFVAHGNLVVEVHTPGGQHLRVRRIATHTVVGEMGFFRRATRTATVSTDGPATLFSLTRDSFERMQRERPDLAGRFYEFVVRSLADRIDAANRAITALTD